GKGLAEADGGSQFSYAKGNPQEGCDDDADEDGAPHALDQHDHGDGQPEQGEQHRGVVQGHKFRDTRIETEQSGVFDADVGDENADTAADGVLKAFRDAFDNQLADFGYGNQNVDHTADEHH